MSAEALLGIALIAGNGILGILMAASAPQAIKRGLGFTALWACFVLLSLSSAIWMAKMVSA